MFYTLFYINGRIFYGVAVSTTRSFNQLFSYVDSKIDSLVSHDNAPFNVHKSKNNISKKSTNKNQKG
jgi:hypothetical protein